MTLLQLLLLTKWSFSSKFQSSMTTFHYKILGFTKYTRLCFNYWHLDEVEVSWDNNTCKLIHKKCHHCDINDHMTLNTICNVVPPPPPKPPAYILVHLGIVRGLVFLHISEVNLLPLKCDSVVRALWCLWRINQPHRHTYEFDFHLWPTIYSSWEYYLCDNIS